MKPKFSLRVAANTSCNIKKARNKSEAAVKQYNQNEKNKQINEAVEWCKTNGKRGYAAMSSGQFPLIKSKIVIDKRLDGLVNTGTEKQHLMILTLEEENTVAQYIKV